MSCRSPCTVPITAVNFGVIPAATNRGSNTAIASFIARAAINISGTKISFRLYCSPMTAIAGTSA